MKRFGVIAIALAGAIAISTGGNALAGSTGRGAPRTIRDNPVCPSGPGYMSDAKDPFPPEQWEPVWAAFQRAVIFGQHYATQPKRPTAGQTQRLQQLFPADSWLKFSIDRQILRPSLKRRITGHYVVTVTDGPCLNSTTGRAFFVARLAPQFRYRGRRVPKLYSLRFVFVVKDGQVVQSYNLPGN
jgi:hypothetical protein